MGIETFSTRLLNDMNKKRSTENNLEAIEAFCSCDIPLEVSNIIGFPGESESDFQKRWEIYLGLIKKYPYNLLINIEPFQLRPSSAMYENLNDFGLSIKKWGNKIINIVPEVKDIVSQIPMVANSKPTPLQIIWRTNNMLDSFRWNRDVEYEYGLRFEKEFLKKSLKSLKYLHEAKFSLKDFYIASSGERKNSKKQMFALCQNGNVKYVISQKEKLMLDKCNGVLPFHQIIKELSLEFNKSKKQCQKEFLEFLNDLLEKDILFRMS
jgi:hypothetical protein